MTLCFGVNISDCDCLRFLRCNVPSEYLSIQFICRGVTCHPRKASNAFSSEQRLFCKPVYWTMWSGCGKWRSQVWVVSFICFTMSGMEDVWTAKYMMTSSNGNIFRVTGTLCGNSPVTGSQRPVTRSFDAFFDLGLNKRLSKQSWGWWPEMPSRSLWRHCNVTSKQRMRSRACHPGGNYWNYYSITLTLSQVTATQLKILKWNAETWLHDRVSG